MDDTDLLDVPTQPAAQPAPEGQWADLNLLSPEAKDAILPPSWEQVKGKYRDKYPALNQDALREHFNDQRNQEIARRVVGTPSVGGRLVVKALPFVGKLAAAKEAQEYGEARKNIDAGRALPGDYVAAAEGEGREQVEQRLQSTAGGQALSAAASVPAIAGEFAATGGIGSGVSGAVIPQGVKVGLPRWALGKALGTAATTAAVPSMYVDKWTADNLKAGRDALDPAGFPAAFGLGMMQTAVFGAIGKVGAKIPGETAGAWARRWAQGVGVGVGGAQAVGVLGGITGLDTGYGLVGDAFDKDKGWGDVGRRLVGEMVTFGLFSAMHAHQPGRAYTVAEAFGNSMLELRRQGWAQDTAVVKMGQPHEILADLLKTNPNPSMEDVAKAMESLPKGPVRKYGQALADNWVRPEVAESPTEATPVPEAPPDIPPASPEQARQVDTEAGSIDADMARKIGLDVPEAAPQAPAAPPGPEVPQGGPPAPEPGTGLINPVQTGVPGVVSGAKEIPAGPFGGLSAEDVGKVSKQLLGKELRSAKGLEDALRQRGLSDQGMRQLADALRQQPATPRQTAEAIEKGFEGMGKAGREAGEERTNELVAKQGYVGFTKEVATEQFAKNNPGWTRETVGGETRFRPPAEERAFRSAFPDAKAGAGGILKGKTETHTVTMEPGSTPDAVKIDFYKNPKPGEFFEDRQNKMQAVGGELEPGSLDVARKLRKVVKGLKEQGKRIEYVTDGHAKVYEQALKKLGYRQVEGPVEEGAKPVFRAWEPGGEVAKPAGAVPPAAAPERPASPPPAEPAAEKPPGVPAGKSPITSVSRNEILSRIDGGEGGLTERQKDILRERLEWGTGMRELGQKHGVSYQTIKNDEARALDALGYDGTVDDLHQSQLGAGAIADVEKGKEMAGQDLHRVDPKGVFHNSRINQISDAMDRLDDLFKKRAAAEKKGKFDERARAKFTAEYERLKRLIDEGQGQGPAAAVQPGAAAVAPGEPGAQPEVPAGDAVNAAPVRRAGDGGLQEVPAAGGPANEAAVAGAPAAEGGAHPPADATGAEAPRDLLSKSFDELEPHGAGGMVWLADLREKSGLSREAFDAAMQELRRERKIRLIAAGGGRGMHKDRVWDAGIAGEDERFIAAERGDQGGQVETPEPAPEAPRYKLNKVNRPWHKAALENGIDPAHLHGMAEQIRADSRREVESHNELLEQVIRESSTKEFEQIARGLTRNDVRRKYEDPSLIPGFDEALDFARKNRTPWQEEDDLYEALKQGKLKPLTWEKAYTKAFADLHERLGNSPYDNPQEVQDEVQKALQSGASQQAVEEVVQRGKDAAREDVAEQAAPPEGGEAAAAAGEREPGVDEPEPASGADSRYGGPGGGAGAGGGPLEEAPFRTRQPRPSLYGDLPERHPALHRAAMSLADATADFFRDEGGYIDPNKLKELYDSARERVVRGVRYVQNELSEFAGRQAPSLSRLSQKAADALVHFAASRVFVERAAPDYIDRVFGKDSTPEDRMLYGNAFYEMRARYAREQYLRASRDASNALLAARARGDQEEAARQARIATENHRAANGVNDFIGPDFPIKDEAQYRKVVNSPRMKEIMRKWKSEFVPEMEKNYRAAQGIDDSDPIVSSTQLPGLPFNAKAVLPGEADTPSTVRMGRGNLKNPKQQRFGFAEQATLGGDAYDIDLGAVIEHSLRHGYSRAMKAQMYRVLESEGVATWGKPGQWPEGAAKELPGINPPKGTQAAERGETSLYFTDPGAYQEVRRVLNVDKAPDAGPVTAFGRIMTNAALLSTVEATAHVKNMLTMMFKPGMLNPEAMVRNWMGRWKNDPETMRRLTELARIGALKPEGFEAGQESVLAKFNPFKKLGKGIDFLQDFMRLQAEDAFGRMAEKGLVEKSEANKRDFINQLGNYNKLTQHRLATWLRDTGIGPFATAATNYTMQGMMSLAADPGLKATSAGSQAWLRARYALKMATVGLAIPFAANYALWGRWDGDDDTPFGAIKTGERDGKTQYIDPLEWTGIKRGMRNTGLLALTEGVRRDEPAGKIANKALTGIGRAALHPMEGPLVSTLHTLATGENTLGMRVAAKAGKDESQIRENFLAALKTVNPTVAQQAGWDQPASKQDEPWTTQRLWGLAGPFGVRERQSQESAAAERKLKMRLSRRMGGRK